MSPERSVKDLFEPYTLFSGGGGGIRTPETLSGLTVFKTAGFNRSPTPPSIILLCGKGLEKIESRLTKTGCIVVAYWIRQGDVLVQHWRTIQRVFQSLHRRHGIAGDTFDVYLPGSLNTAVAKDRLDGLIIHAQPMKIRGESATEWMPPAPTVITPCQHRLDMEFRTRI
jgi:hypothetical protein